MKKIAVKDQFMIWSMSYKTSDIPTCLMAMTIALRKMQNMMKYSKYLFSDIENMRLRHLFYGLRFLRFGVTRTTSNLVSIHFF